MPPSIPEIVIPGTQIGCFLKHQPFQVTITDVAFACALMTVQNISSLKIFAIALLLVFTNFILMLYNIILSLYLLALQAKAENNVTFLIMQACMPK